MVTLFWVGQSLFNVSVYVKDARAQALPLLGGEDVTPRLELAPRQARTCFAGTRPSDR